MSMFVFIFPSHYPGRCLRAGDTTAMEGYISAKYRRSAILSNLFFLFPCVHNRGVMYFALVTAQMVAEILHMSIYYFACYYFTI